MTCQLKCTTPTETFRWTVRTGEKVRVGCSPWVEMQLPAEFGITPEHFSVCYHHQLEIRSLGDSELFVDGIAITSTVMDVGMTVTAGDCRFTIENAVNKTTSSLDQNDKGKIIDAHRRCYVWEQKEEIIQDVALSDEAKQVLQPVGSPWEAVDTLISKKLCEDSVRLLAGCLETEALISWAVFVVGRAELPPNTSVLELARQWCSAPSEAARQSVEDSIHWADTSSLWTWLLAAISWTGGSLTSHVAKSQHGVAAIPPPKRMVVAAIIAVMQLACCQTDAAAFRTMAIESGLNALRSQHHEDLENASRR